MGCVLGGRGPPGTTSPGTNTDVAETARCGTGSPGEAPHRSLWVQARSPKGKVLGFRPRVEEAQCGRRPGRAPVPAKCCLRASGQGAGGAGGAGGADGEAHVNSNEDEDKTPDTLRTHSRRSWELPMSLCWTVSPGPWPLGKDCPRPLGGLGEETDPGRQLFWEEGLRRQVRRRQSRCVRGGGAPGRAGMVASVGVASFRRAWQAFQCFPRSPCTSWH